MQFEIVPAHEVSITDQARVFNAAFAGYLAGSVALDAPSFARFGMLQGADLFYSRFGRIDGDLAGFGYITRTFGVSRLSAMGVIPQHRRCGAASRLLQNLVEEAVTRGDDAMVLEVFEQNETALPLYRHHGFDVVYRLLGWKRAAAKATMSTSSIDEIPLRDVLRAVSTPDFPDIPWQISVHAMAKLLAPRAYRGGNVVVVLADGEANPLQIRGIFELRPATAVEISSAIAGVIKKFPEREFFVPAIFPERFAEILAPLEFTREKLNQFLMRRNFR